MQNLPVNLYIRLSIASVAIGLATFSIVQGQERKIKREQLPLAVEKTVAEQSKDATINGFSTEVEKGRRLYEVELTVSDQTERNLRTRNRLTADNVSKGRSKTYG